MHNDPLDRLLETVCKEDWNEIEGLKDIEVPDMEKMLQKVEIQANREPFPTRIRRWAKVMGTAAAVLICSFLISVILDLPQVDAFKFKMIRTMVEVKDDVTMIHQTNVDYSAIPKGDTPPPPTSFNEERMEEKRVAELNRKLEEAESQGKIQETTKVLSLEEAKNEFPAPLLSLEYIPEGFTLKEVKLTNYSDDIYKVEQELKKGEEISLRLSQTYYTFDGDFASGMVTTGEVKDIEVMGQKGILIVYKRQDCTVSWRVGQSEYKIDGQVTEEEMRKMVKKVKLNQK